MSTLHWILFAVCLSLGALFVLGNLSTLVSIVREHWRGGDKNHSFVPPLGPFIIVLGCHALLPDPPWWVWLVWLLDPAAYLWSCCLPFLIRDIVASRTKQKP